MPQRWSLAPCPQIKTVMQLSCLLEGVIGRDDCRTLLVKSKPPLGLFLMFEKYNDSGKRYADTVSSRDDSTGKLESVIKIF
jgi:hypothetical protein